ncbi:MAG: MerR family DNA-binding protein, partial [Rhodothermales bacterium]
VNVQTVRYYERKGLIPRAPRSAGGYRQYGEETVKRIRFIKHAQEIGFSLREIDALLSLRVDTHTTCADVQKRAEEKMIEIEEKIRKLERVKQAIQRMVVLCDTEKAVRDCPFLEALDEVSFSVP